MKLTIYLEYEFLVRNLIMSRESPYYRFLIMRYCSLQEQPPEVFYKKSVLKNFAMFSYRKAHVLESQKKKYIPEDLQLHLKKAPTQLLSCEYCEIFKNTYFEEHLQTTASVP